MRIISISHIVLLQLLMMTLSAHAAESENCHAHYYGIGQAKNFPKAYRCYEKDREWQYLIVMHLNGEGVPRDPLKAQAIFKRWEEQEPGLAQTLEGEVLKAVIEEHLANPAKKEKVDWCGKIAATTISINICGSIYTELEVAALDTHLAEIRRKLASPQQRLFDKVVTSFKAFSEADGKRVYQLYIDGTIRNMAAINQEKILREHFQAMLYKTIEVRTFPNVDETGFISADAKLQQVYNDNLQSYESNYAVLLQAPSLQDQHELYKRYIKEYRAASHSAQLHWITYRDQYMQLVMELYKSKKYSANPEWGIKYLLTKLREDELTPQTH